jgi:glutaconate CoA-transferase, subunit A
MGRKGLQAAKLSRVTVAYRSTCSTGKESRSDEGREAPQVGRSSSILTTRRRHEGAKSLGGVGHVNEVAAPGTLFSPPDVDGLREFFRTKPRNLVSKLMSAKEAVSAFIQDGDYLGVGGFGSNRIPTALLHEVVRQRKKNLGFSGHTSTHDFQILVGGGCIARCDSAYVLGLEARGLSMNGRRAYESGAIKSTEWSNAALAWRYKAAAMGVPFLPSRVMLGTDTFKYSGAKVMDCPFTGTKVAALPALSPDIALIHVQRADEFGNAQIDGITVADLDLARASKHVVLSCERLVPTEEIRSAPHLTAIPYYCVDAVVVQRYGGYPGNVAYEYFSDEEHLKEWLRAEADPSEFEVFLNKYIYGVKDFDSYLALKGGEDRMRVLRAEEMLKSDQG